MPVRRQKRSPRFLILRHYFHVPVFDTTSPSTKGGAWTAVGLTASWDFHPRQDLCWPPSLRDPHFGGLRLDGSIIIPDRIIAKQLATGCFVDRWTRSSPCLAIMDGSAVRRNQNKDCFGSGCLQNHRRSWRILQCRLLLFIEPCQESIQATGYEIFKLRSEKILFLICIREEVLVLHSPPNQIFKSFCSFFMIRTFCSWTALW